MSNIEGRRPERAPAWRWWVCGLLLLATMINYMDRLTLNLLATPIKDAFQLNDRDYGLLESGFARAFALGSIIVGWMADRWNVRWMYPLAVLAWSLAGFATGFAQGFFALLLCRVCLGLAEAGNWPCALRTTQQILPPAERSMGNSILQSGAAVGAVVTPLIILGLVSKSPAADSSWRYPFVVIGTLGILWVLGWLASVRNADLHVSRSQSTSSLLNIAVLLLFLFGLDMAVRYNLPGEAVIRLGVTGLTTVVGIGGIFLWLRAAVREDSALPGATFQRRYWVLVTLVVCINLTWHYLRAWLPLYLQSKHGYSVQDSSYFSIAYYIAADAGSLTAGYIALRLARGGIPVHRSRVLVFGTFAVLTALALWVSSGAELPWALSYLGPSHTVATGWILPAILVLTGFFSLGMFPNYYSLNQELNPRHQGKVTGALGCTCWLAMALLHDLVGENVERTKSYALGFTLAGVAPLIALAALLMFWGSEPVHSKEQL